MRYLIALLAAAAYAQTGTVDYVMGVKNKPEVDPRNYVFIRTNGAGASGTLTSAGAGKTVTLTPCPAGITSASINHSYVRIYSGTGTAEAVPITNVSPSGSNCTITITTANTHSGSWIVGNNGNGLQEALIAAAAAEMAVHATARTYAIYAPIYVPGYAKIRGDGRWRTFFQAQTDNIVVLDAPEDHNTFEDFGISILGNDQGASGSVGIQLGTVSATNSFSTFTRLFFDFLYEDIKSINATQLHITDCTFYDPTYTSVTLANPLDPDNVGGQFENNLFFTDVSGTAHAFVLITSTSSNQFVNNNFIGSANIEYCINNTATTSGGWMNVTGNKCESASVGAFRMSGTWTQLTMVGNTLGNSGGVSNWVGIQITGTGTQYRNAIGPNVIQCGGTGNRGIFLSGTYQTTTMAGNEIMSCDTGIYASGTPTNVLIGQNNITGSIISPVYAVSSGVIVDMPGPFTYAIMTDTSAGIGSAGNGSRIFCSNCTSTCGAGSSTGRTCFRENSTWTH